MEEIEAVLSKYDEDYIKGGLQSLESLGPFSTRFYGDVAEIYDTFTRLRNVERNPTGFSFDDAPILGLLVRMWKLLKEIVAYYEADNGELVGVLDRIFFEAAVTAHFLMLGDSARIEDYRKCSYRHRLRMLKEAGEDRPFYDTKAGKRLVASIRAKLDAEGFAPSDFTKQKKNRWKVEGKSFYEILEEVHSSDLYPMTFGIMSESVHGSWNEAMDFCLVTNSDGTFSTFPFFQSADPRFVAPLVMFGTPPYRLWLQRIDAATAFTDRVLDWIEALNTRIYLKFDDGFDGP